MIETEDIPNKKKIAYRYMCALYGMARKKPPILANPDDTASLDHFLRTNQAATCRVCGRWYLATVNWCHLHHVQLELRSSEQFITIAQDWEAFRSGLNRSSGIKTVTLDVAIKLHHLQHSPEEER